MRFTLAKSKSTLFLCSGFLLRKEIILANQKHLTKEDRMIIETGLTNGSTRKSIADTLGKSPSTICKEVKNNSYFEEYSQPYMRKQGTYDCTKIAQCGFNTFCKDKCSERTPIPCKRRDRTVGVCNGCPLLTERQCRLDRQFYNADRAHTKYLTTLSDAREGVNLTTSQAQELGKLLKDGVSRGLSLYAIKQAHPEIPYSERTLYNYIQDGVFSCAGLINIDLPVKMKRKVNKPIKTKIRENKAYLKGRTYKDFEDFMQTHPSLPVVEMDTCYNSVTNGPFIQTFQFVEYNLMIGIYHEQKTASAMYEGVALLKERLGTAFEKIVPVILTDRGSEFTMAKEIESLGCRVFYCDPMASWQKPHVENNHLLFRKICPKQTDLKALGLDSQEKTDLVFSHINSYPREEKGDRSPIEIFRFFHRNSDLIERLHLKEIGPDKLQLTPGLLRARID